MLFGSKCLYDGYTRNTAYYRPTHVNSWDQSDQLKFIWHQIKIFMVLSIWRKPKEDRKWHRDKIRRVGYLHKTSVVIWGIIKLNVFSPVENRLLNFFSLIVWSKTCYETREFGFVLVVSYAWSGRPIPQLSTPKEMNPLRESRDSHYPKESLHLTELLTFLL